MDSHIDTHTGVIIPVSQQLTGSCCIKIDSGIGVKQG